MGNGRLATYLRTHRRSSGLSQHEVARLLGYKSAGEISRHERATTLPSLRVAVAYQIIFRVPIAELFPELHKETERTIDRRLMTLENELQDSTPKGRHVALVARKLEWCWERRNH